MYKAKLWSETDENVGVTYSSSGVMETLIPEAFANGIKAMQAKTRNINFLYIRYISFSC